MVLVVGALALLVVLVAAVAVWASRPDPVLPAPQDQPGPVLLVPGYGGTGESLGPLAAAVRASGREAVIVPPVGDGTGDLRVQAANLAEVAQAALDRSGAPSVDVVGYSAGGVVARLWVRDEDGARIARRVLTLGSPQHGTSQAALGAEVAGGCPTACQQLVPDSDVLRRLNAGDETPAGPQWVTVRSTADQVVTPVDSAALEGALNVVVQDLCAGSTTTHGELPTDPVVRALLGSTLATGPPALPTDLDC